MPEPLHDPLLSIVFPVFNEARTVAETIRRVLAQPFRLEVIAVDDGSTDGTLGILEGLAREHRVLRVLCSPVNQGKGAALRRGFDAATGDIIIVQDADLEYDPRDYGILTEGLVTGRADVVYGSRFLGESQAFGGHRRLANHFLTALSNACTHLALTDMETCYKAFRREVLLDLHLREDRFGFEPEFTARIAGRRYRVDEVPVSYAGRTHRQGKKIGWRDGLWAVWVILRSRAEEHSG